MVRPCCNLFLKKYSSKIGLCGFNSYHIWSYKYNCTVFVETEKDVVQNVKIVTWNLSMRHENYVRSSNHRLRGEK